MTAAAPLVRNEHGAVLGVDWRRTELSPVVVPGVVKACEVAVGDTVSIGQIEGVVITKRGHGTPGKLHLGIRTPGGAEIFPELRESERVHVTAVGAFDR